MSSLSLGSTSRSDNSTASQVFAVTPPTPNSYMLIAVAIASGSATVSSMSAGTGTFVKVGGKVAGSQSLELWVGYNFGTSAPASLTVTFSTGSLEAVTICRTVAVDGDCSFAPTATASAGGNGASVTPDPAAITPAVGNLLFAAAAWNSTNASTARTLSGNTYSDNQSVTATAFRLETVWGEAAAASSSDVTWTITSATWVAVQVKLAPHAPAAATAALVVKGLDTAALDAASAF